MMKDLIQFFAFGLKTGDEFIIFVKFGENNLNQKIVEENWNFNDILKTRENKITLYKLIIAIYIK